MEPAANSRAQEPLRPYAVVDLDGVVADVRHRLRFLASRPKDWDGFFGEAPSDDVLPEGAAVVHELVGRGLEVVWLTGRPERCRRDTVRWLAQHALPDGRLFMRSDRDRRPARVTKLEVVRRLASQRNVAVVVDDDDLVVHALREAGFEVLHARWMDEPAAPAEQSTLFDAQEDEGRT